MIEPENLVLELLRALRADIAELRDDITEIKLRQNDTHRAVLASKRDQSADAETVAHVQAQMDRVRERIARIERRLDLRDE